MLSGRGAGKTRTGSEWVHEEAMQGDERRRIALIGKTPGDVRDVMVEGISGIMKIAAPGERPDYQPTKRRLTWPTGATATVYSGANPEQLRGFSGDRAWLDEMCAWKYQRETWDNLIFGMREAQLDDPKMLITTTPKAQPLIKEILQLCEDPEEFMYHLTRTSSYANRLNLSPIYYKTVIEPLEGTTLGEQEIHARILADDPDAYWKREWIEDNRLGPKQAPTDFHRIVVSVDPQAGTDGNETGIIVAAVDRTKSVSQHGYILENASANLSPNKWAERAVALYKGMKADLIVAEKNQGGEMVKNTIHTVDPNVPVKLTFASKGKAKRFEPIANLYEQGRVHHIGTYGDLEDQMCTWHEDAKNMPSPDQADALAWAIFELMVDGFDPIVEFESLNSAQFAQEPSWKIN